MSVAISLHPIYHEEQERICAGGGGGGGGGGQYMQCMYLNGGGKNKQVFASDKLAVSYMTIPLFGQFLECATPPPTGPPTVTRLA